MAEKAPPAGKDRIYATAHKKLEDFRFDQSVAAVFPDMIQRSVPGYDTIVDTISHFTHTYAKPNTRLYDLGCSLGAASVAMRRGNHQENVELIAVDNSEAMVQRCEQHLAMFRSDTPYEVHCEDILDTTIENASMVVMNFTLQFIEPALRQQLLENIYRGLVPGGILILSEKLKHPEAKAESALVQLHHDFKRRNGYSELEISQKRSALENVMRIDSHEQHMQRLQQIGFSAPTLWYQCFNFASMVAFKEAS